MLGSVSDRRTVARHTMTTCRRMNTLGRSYNSNDTYHLLLLRSSKIWTEILLTQQFFQILFSLRKHSTHEKKLVYAMSSKSLTIVITGASRGLGAGMAGFYLERGHKLGLCSRSPPPPALATSDNPNLYYQSNIDVSDPEAIKDFTNQVLQRFGPKIDLWINNAGILGPIQPIRKYQPQDLEENLQINLMGVFHGTQAYIRHLHQRDNTNTTSAILVNISSGAAVKGYAGWSAYCASKAGVDRLTECALLEEQSELPFFRAYSIAPGIVDTDMQTQIRSTSKENFPMLDKFLDVKEKDVFNTPAYVASKIESLALLEGPQTLPVVQRLPSEKE